MKKFPFLALVVSFFVISCGGGDGEHTLHVLTTNDVHGKWFDSAYVTGGGKPSLMDIDLYVDSIRNEVGAENVLLIDAGDCLQGDNASYYYNYVRTDVPHLFPRLVSYMGYDAICVGNHDIETGHPVYDKVKKELSDLGIPFLAGNAIDTETGKQYFDYYKTFRKASMKILVIGYTNANIKAWLNESLWQGMRFDSLLPLVQEDVDRLRKKEKPDVVIVAAHTGVGEGDGTVLESQAMDLFNSLNGVDILVASHDHRAKVESKDGMVMVNAGSNGYNIGHSVLTIKKEKGKEVSREVGASLIYVDGKKENTEMIEAFREEFEEVKSFTLQEVGELKSDLSTSESFVGMSPYMNFLHTVCLMQEPAEISIAAPLNQNQTIKSGTLLYNDMFALYKYENQLFVVEMTGEEIRLFLENSYDIWINTIPSGHLLKIHSEEDRSGKMIWSFDNPSYNFDSAAGINYTVDVTKPFGERVNISTLADGDPFELDHTYNVAMTSYRASGGGATMVKAGIDTDNIDGRVVAKYPEIRDLIYDYIKGNGVLDPAELDDPAVLGHWSFVPEPLVKPLLERDYKLLFE